MWQSKAKTLFGLLLACCCQAGVADPYYTGTPHSAYPPGCISGPLNQLDLTGDNVAVVWDGSLWLDVAHKVQSQDEFTNRGLVDVKLFRVYCAEPNRSVILVEFRLPAEWVDPRYSQLVLPSLGGDGLGMHYVPFDLKAEPNRWGQSIEQQSLTRQAIGDYTNGWDDARRFTWRYVLDIGPAGRYWDVDLLTEYYNGSFPLVVFADDGSTDQVIEVPATRPAPGSEPALPLNGRLTGTWVEEGAADQGFLLSFSNPIPPARSATAEPERSELTVFLSWYTFDAQGGLLWLTGAGRFPQGATEVSIPIVHVTQGQFLGSQPANRAVVGSARLKARQCNELEFEYDLANLGLGAGDLRLQRLQALEIAGYPCRDYTARRDSLALQ
jgi:hypothetical protein